MSCSPASCQPVSAGGGVAVRPQEEEEAKLPIGCSDEQDRPLPASKYIVVALFIFGGKLIVIIQIVTMVRLLGSSRLPSLGAHSLEKEAMALLGVAAALCSAQILNKNDAHLQL